MPLIKSTMLYLILSHFQIFRALALYFSNAYFNGILQAPSRHQKKERETERERGGGLPSGQLTKILQAFSCMPVRATRPA
jgi:hypothetical protein